MERIIGDKEAFAIEFEISNEMQFMGYAKLWLQGNLLGAPKDLIYFEGYLFDLLDQFCNSRILEDKFANDSVYKVYRLLKKYTYELYDENYKASIYSCSGATFTDDFYVFSYLEKGIINILWKVRKNANYADIKKLGGGLFHFKMEQIKFCKLVIEYKKYIRNFLPPFRVL